MFTVIKGKDCKVENINFSFSICNDDDIGEVNIEWNDNGGNSFEGIFSLIDYKYYQTYETKKRLTQEEIDFAREFFKKYKVLFAACWSNVLHPIDLKNYFEGKISFDSLLNEFYNVDYFDKLSKVETLDDLSYVVREYNMYNLYE